LPFSILYQKSFAKIPYEVDPRAIKELLWLRQAYGISNETIILVIRDSNAWPWAQALLSPITYYGNLAYLLANLTEPDMPLSGGYLGGLQTLQRYQALKNLNKFSIIVTEHTYRPDNIERKILREIHNNIYIVSPLTKDQVNAFFVEWTSYHSKPIYTSKIDDYLTLKPWLNLEAFLLIGSIVIITVSLLSFLTYKYSHSSKGLI